eukprot:288275_1
MASHFSFYNISLILCHLISLIYLFVSIYGNIKLFKLREQIFLQKRNISIVFGLNATFIITLTSVSVNQFIANHSNISVQIFSATLSVTCIWVFLYFINVKNWIIYYKYKWTHFTLQFKWQQLINNTDNSDDNWYIKNNYKYGNTLYICKLFGLLHAIGLIITIICTPFYKMGKGNIFAFSLFSMFISALLYLIIVLKTPNFDDTFFIHWENKMQCKLSSLLICGLVFSSIIGVVTKDRLLANLIAAFITTSTLFALNYVSTFAIWFKNKHMIVNIDTALKSHDNQYGIEAVANFSVMSIENVADKKYKKNNNISVDMILTNDKAIHLFMIYLSKEYSMECLLAFIEITQ